MSIKPTEIKETKVNNLLIYSQVILVVVTFKTRSECL